jgi:hypothetical protein
MAVSSCKTKELKSDLLHGGGHGPLPKGPFTLIGVDRIEKKPDGIQLSYKAPCQSLKDETLVVSSPDSGVEGYELGIVYNTSEHFCTPGPSKEFLKVVSSTDQLFEKLSSQSATVKGLNVADYVFTAAHYISRSVGKLTAVIFVAPCKEVQFDVLVGVIDSSGDKVLSVGVVYPKTHCVPGDSRKINRFIKPDSNPETFARLGGNDATLKRVEPMLVLDPN